ncbi:hypothetical protein D9M68_874590 [compost metagenome]
MIFPCFIDQGKGNRFLQAFDYRFDLFFNRLIQTYLNLHTFHTIRERDHHILDLTLALLFNIDELWQHDLTHRVGFVLIERFCLIV